MRDYKVNANRGFKEWQWRMTQHHNYIMYLPSEALENRGAVKQEFTEIEMRKILDITVITRNCLESIGISMNKSS